MGVQGVFWAQPESHGTGPTLITPDGTPGGRVLSYAGLAEAADAWTRRVMRFGKEIVPYPGGEALPRTGALPFLLAVVHALLRLAALVLAVLIVAAFIPSRIGPVLPFVLLAAAVATLTRSQRRETAPAPTSPGNPHAGVTDRAGGGDGDGGSARRKKGVRKFAGSVRVYHGQMFVVAFRFVREAEGRAS